MFHEAFVDKFAADKNKIFFKFAIKETLQILFKLIQDLNDLNPDKTNNLINILFCLNHLLQQQISCYPSLRKKVHLSLYIVEIIEHILMELSKKNLREFDEIAKLMKKFYLTVFQNILTDKTLVQVNNNVLLINLLETLFEFIMTEFDQIPQFSNSSKPKKTLKFVNLGLNLISKLLSLNIEQIFLEKLESFSQISYNKSFTIYQKSMRFCHSAKHFLTLLFKDETPMEYEHFFQNYMDSSSEFYKKISNCLLDSSSVTARMLLKTFMTITDILNYFNFQEISISCSQICILIVSTGRELNFSEEEIKTNEKNLWNLTLQARISYILQKMANDYKKIGFKESVEKIQVSFERNFLESFAETKKYLKLLNTKLDVQYSYYIEDLKQNNRILQINHEILKLSNSKNFKLSTKTTEISILLAKISKKFVKKRTLGLLHLQSRVIILLSKNLMLLGLHAFAFSLLNNYNFFWLLNKICEFKDKEFITSESIQNSRYNTLAHKGILGITNSRIWEMKHQPLRKESKSWFVSKIIEKSVVFNDFWKINLTLSKTFRMLLEICNEKTGTFSFSKYYEKLFLSFEIKNLRVTEFFRILNISKNFFNSNDSSDNFQNNFKRIFDEIFVFSRDNNFEKKQEFLGIFFPIRKSLSSKVSLSEIKKKCEKLFKGCENLSNNILISELFKFLLDFFHQEFSVCSNTKNLELFMIKKLISKQFSLKKKKTDELFSIFSGNNPCNNCKIFGGFLKNDLENMLVSTCSLKILHNLHKINKNILENDFLMYFLNFLNKNQDFNFNAKLVSLLNLRNLLYIITNEVSVHNIDLAYHYLYLFYQYEAKIFQALSELMKENKSEFTNLIDKISNLSIFECSCEGLVKNKKSSLIFSMKMESLLLMKFFNKPYDFKLFLKEYDMKMKEETTENIKEPPNLRNSFKNLHIFDNISENQVTKSLKVGFGVHIPNNLNQLYLRNLVEKNMGENCLVYLKYLEENNEKLLLIGRINMKKKNFFCYKIDSQHKLNFIKDYINDFNTTIKMNEEDMKEFKNKNSASAGKKWWENRFKIKIENL